jgi:hypothetical protein
VGLADYVHGRRKVLGTVGVNERDNTVGDLSPGVVTCERTTGASSWCPNGEGAFQLGDMVTVRRLVAGTRKVGCDACSASTQQAATRPPSPGDVAPRGAPDGAVDIGDVVLGLRMAVGLEEPSARERLLVDVAPVEMARGSAVVRADDAVTVADVVVLLRSAVGLTSLLWPEDRLVVHVAEPVGYVGARRW